MMILWLTLLCFTQVSWADSNIDHYIRKFNYRPLIVPIKQKALYDLGFKLFYDKGLSGKNNISCQSCHSLMGYSGDNLPLGIGEGATGIAHHRMQDEGKILSRNTPPIYNLSSQDVKTLFWDGRVSQAQDGSWITPWPLPPDAARTLSSVLAVQSIFPLTDPKEMLGKESTLNPTEAWHQVMERIFQGRFRFTYQKMFSEAFPGEENFNIGHVGNALAELMRHHFNASNTLWDLYLKGHKNALSERMKRGAVLFHTLGNCVSCHSGDHFTSWGFQNIGVPQIGPDDKGRFEVTKNPQDMYKFRVPPLRNVGLTAPYMHSGAFKTLWEVIDHYDHPRFSMHHFKWDPIHPNYTDSLNLDTNRANQHNRERNLSPKLPTMLDLSLEQKADLFCFLAVALTDVSLQMDLIQKGMTNEISDCSPRPYF